MEENLTSKTKQVLNWNHILELKCPNCYADLTKNGSLFTCLCDFKIGREKAREIGMNILEERDAGKVAEEEFNELLDAD